MTHYRQFYDKHFLAGEDLEPGENLNLTISSAEGSEVQSAQGSEEKLVISFEEIDKKYIPGIQMAKVIGTIAGSRQVEDWPGVKIEIHQAEEKHFGEIMPVLRISRPVDSDVLNLIKGAKSRADLKKIYESLKPHEKTDKTITELMIKIKKSLT